MNKHLKWLESEYLTKDGKSIVDLVYIDYRDSFDENVSGLMQFMRQGYMDDESWIWESQDESIRYIINEYRKTLGDDEELSEADEDEMRQWLQENDTSDPYMQLLKNTRDMLFFIETNDLIEIGGEDWENKKDIIQKYARTDEQKNEIEYLYRETFETAPLSFYFYISPVDLYKAIWPSDIKDNFIIIDGAYMSSIDRVAGGNWLGDHGVFKIAIPKEQFIKTIYADQEKGTGYSWDSIAGMVGYDEAGIFSGTEIGNALLIDTIESESLKREQELEKKWNNGRGTCTFGDMNWNRHGEKEYINEIPCGSHCKVCRNFWID